MTKENRERAYKHFRDLQEIYVAPEGRNHSATSTNYVRQRAQALADRLLIKNPELKEFDPKPEPKQEAKPKKEESDGKKPKR